MGETTVAHHGDGARENARNLRQTLRIRPIFFRRVLLDLRHRPIPRHIPRMNTEGRRKKRTAGMGKQGVFQGSQNEREVFF